MARTMPQISRRAFTLSLASTTALAACGGPVPEQAPNEVSLLANGIMALNPTIDPQEARRAAQIGIEYPKVLRARYQVEDPPLAHNVKVNRGTKPRGLCWHWADDMQARLEQENFQTLVTHRAIANAYTRLLIDHSTVIVSAVGDTYDEGMVMDPWRYGGVLYWSPTLEDERYTWVHRQVVFDWKRERGILRTREASSEAVPEA